MKYFLKPHSLIIGLLLMFLYTWTIDLSNSGVLQFKLPFFVYITLGWGFIFVSLFMTWATLGKESMVTFLKRLMIWRVGWKWWLVALLLSPALQFASVLMTSWLTGTPVDCSHLMIREVIPIDAPLLALVLPWLIFEILTNGEEWGWRGYVLPRLQAKYNALTASLILGAIWSFWHLPKFLGTGLGNERSFPWFAISQLALAVLYTWLYNNTRGSILLVVLFHATENTAGMFLPASFAVAGGIIENLPIVLSVLTAIVVIIFTGPSHLSRTEERQMQNLIEA